MIDVASLRRHAALAGLNEWEVFAAGLALYGSSYAIAGDNGDPHVVAELGMRLALDAAVALGLIDAGTVDQMVAAAQKDRHKVTPDALADAWDAYFERFREAPS